MAKRKTGSKVKPKKIESLSIDDPNFDEKFAELEEEYRLMRMQQMYEDSLKPRRGMARGGVPKKKMMRGGGMANGKKPRIGSSDFRNGGMVTGTTNNLKPVPSGKKGKGLSMLPKSARNNMGFMKKGGMAKK